MSSADWKIPSFEEVIKNNSLSSAIHLYIDKGQELKKLLDENPGDYVKYQGDINKVVDAVSRELALFEKSNSEEKTYKLKRFFIQKLRKYFLHGHYITTSLNKPYGYAGDFKIIDDIYANKSPNTGFERLWDEYFLRMGPAIATRNRKEDFKKIIIDFISKRSSKEIRIMDLASGPCRELKELMDEYPDQMQNVIIDCYDFDEHAIQYAKDLVKDYPSISFFQKNALRMALKKNIKDEIPCSYDFIFSTGLFDYLDERIAVRLVSNLKKLLNPDGLLCISNYRAKKHNPWAHLMEWVSEWDLVYREDEEFIKVFTDAGFKKDQINTQYEPLKIMLYCLATLSEK